MCTAAPARRRAAEKGPFWWHVVLLCQERVFGTARVDQRARLVGRRHEPLTTRTVPRRWASAEGGRKSGEPWSRQRAPSPAVINILALTAPVVKPRFRPQPRENGPPWRLERVGGRGGTWDWVAAPPNETRRGKPRFSLGAGGSKRAAWKGAAGATQPRQQERSLPRLHSLYDPGCRDGRPRKQPQR